MRTLLTLLLIGFSLTVFSQTGPEIQFDSTDYDFGEVEMGTVVEKVYRFTNVGDMPLIVSKAKPGCGCTKVEFQPDTLQPGEWGSFTMIFDTKNRLGQERNSVTVWTGKKQYRKVTFHGVIVPVKNDESLEPED